MNILAYGGGTNTVAYLIGLRKEKIPLDYILFADTGAEMPHTYEYIEKVMQPWLKVNGFPPITTVRYYNRLGERLTLEQECLASGTLPSLAYGRKRCSQKHKIQPQDKFGNNHPAFRAVWEQGDKITKHIGYGADEQRRISNAIVYDIQDKKYKKAYLLNDWGLGREDCVNLIKQEGLPLPGKSSCFFCPGMKKHEILQLMAKHPDLIERALTLEANAQPNLISVKGLGRNWAWRDFLESTDAQIGLCGIFDDIDMPCGCYDGD